MLLATQRTLAVCTSRDVNGDMVCVGLVIFSFSTTTDLDTYIVLYLYVTALLIIFVNKKDNLALVWF